MEQPNALSSRHNASKWQTYIVLVDWCLEYLCDSNACLLLRSIGCVPLTSWYFSRLCVLMLYTTANQSCFSPLWAVFPPGNRQRAQCLGKLVYCISQSVDRTMEECAVRHLFFPVWRKSENSDLCHVYLDVNVFIFCMCATVINIFLGKKVHCYISVSSIAEGWPACPCSAVQLFTRIPLCFVFLLSLMHLQK